MPPTISREYRWDRTEAADAFVAKAESWGMSLEELRAIARLADDTDDAIAIWEFIDALRRRAGSER
jgi:cytidylate kinase